MKNSNKIFIKEIDSIPRNIGTIYFMTERDLFGYECAPYVKIGLVSENELGRTAANRRDEHQTGNPRKIIVKEEVKTMASVSSLEALVHQRLSSKRIHGEWFSYGEEGIESYVQITKEINQKLESELKNEKVISQMGKLEDNGEVIKPSTEVLDIFEELKVIQEEIQALKFKKEFIELKLKSYGGNNPFNIQDICFYEVSKPVKRFDTKRFKIEHPNVAEQISKKIITPRFTVKNRLKKLFNSEYQDLINICKTHNLKKKTFEDLDRNRDTEELHAQWLYDHSCLQPLSLKKKYLENKLKIFTGENSSIDGICNWSRKPSLKFTKTDVENYDKELANSYLTIGEPTLKFRVNIFRPYNF